MIEVDIALDRGGFRLEAAFSAPSNGVTALFGRSGSGKTTVVNAIAGLVRPDRGRIAVSGRALFDSAAGIDTPTARRRLGYVFQEGRLFPHMTVRRNLLYGRRGGGARPGFDETVALLGLGGLLDRRPASLSGGERQRAAIGRALLSGPGILLMDEPLASLDDARRADILPYLARLREALDIPVVYVSHRMDEVLRLADTMVLLSEGRTVAAGPVEEVAGRLDPGPADGADGADGAGAVLSCRVGARDEAFALARLDFDGGAIWTPAPDAPVGTRVRLRVRARDVSIALEPPGAVSILNVIPARVTEVGPADGPYVEIGLAAGRAALRARLTRRSADALALAPGMEVHAMVKAASIDRASLGVRRPAGS